MCGAIGIPAIEEEAGGVRRRGKVSRAFTLECILFFDDALLQPLVKGLFTQL